MGLKRTYPCRPRLQAWGSSFVVLDSENGALSLVNPSTGEVKRHFKVAEVKLP